MIGRLTAAHGARADRGSHGQRRRKGRRQRPVARGPIHDPVALMQVRIFSTDCSSCAKRCKVASVSLRPRQAAASEKSGRRASGLPAWGCPHQWRERLGQGQVRTHGLKRWAARAHCKRPPVMRRRARALRWYPQQPPGRCHAFKHREDAPAISCHPMLQPLRLRRAHRGASRGLDRRNLGGMVRRRCPAGASRYRCRPAHSRGRVRAGTPQPPRLVMLCHGIERCSCRPTDKRVRVARAFAHCAMSARWGRLSLSISRQILWDGNRIDPWHQQLRSRHGRVRLAWSLALSALSCRHHRTISSTGSAAMAQPCEPSVWSAMRWPRPA